MLMVAPRVAGGRRTPISMRHSDAAPVPTAAGGVGLQAPSDAQLFGLPATEAVLEAFERCSLVQTYTCTHNNYTPDREVPPPLPPSRAHGAPVAVLNVPPCVWSLPSSVRFVHSLLEQLLPCCAGTWVARKWLERKTWDGR